MTSHAFCLISLIGVVLVYGKTTVPKICWDSKWYNNSTPTTAKRSDYKTQPANVLNSICTDGKVIAARCRDQKGELITGFKNDSTNQYIAKCRIDTGLVCNLYNNSKAICPDFEIQYGCACPKTRKRRGGVAPPPVSTIGVTSGNANPVGSTQGASVRSTTGTIGAGGVTTAGTTSGTPNPGSGNANTVGPGQGASVSTTPGAIGTAGQQHGQCGNGAPRYEISQFMLITCIILKVLG